MTAEQIRDSVLYVSGALDEHLGGPSEALTPLGDRRTIYGSVSRYKLDEYLQLFDFPSPSHDRRAALHDQRAAAAPVLHEQRLHAAAGRALAEQVADEPDDHARIEKAYRLALRPRRRRMK